VAKRHRRWPGRRPFVFDAPATHAIRVRGQAQAFGALLRMVNAATDATAVKRLRAAAMARRRSGRGASGTSMRFFSN